MAFYRKSGKPNAITVTAKTSTDIAIGDMVKLDAGNNQVDADTTNSGALRVGIAMDAKASSTAGSIRVDVLGKKEWFVGTVSTGTPAAGDFDYCDLNNSADGVTLTASNNDFVYQYNGSTDTVNLYIP